MLVIESPVEHSFPDRRRRTPPQTTWQIRALQCGISAECIGNWETDPSEAPSEYYSNMSEEMFN